MAITLYGRFQKITDLSNLNEAIALLQELLKSIPDGHQNHLFSKNLGMFLTDLYHLSQNPDNMNQAAAAFCTAVECESSPVSDRFIAAKIWANKADDTKHSSALEAYQTAIGLLPRLAMLGLDLQSRHHALMSGSDGLARNSAACAINLGELEKAVQFLEEGWSVYWSQILQLRTPLDRLHLCLEKSQSGRTGTKLAEELEHISYLLEMGSQRDVTRNLLSDTHERVLSMEAEAVQYSQLAEEWSATVEEVRQMKGFEDFLLPQPLKTLQCAAANGPNVILNASHLACAALILTPTEIRHVSLSGITLDHAYDLVQVMRALTSTTTAFHDVVQTIVQRNTFEDAENTNTQLKAT